MNNKLFYSLEMMAKITSGKWKNLDTKEIDINDIVHIIKHVEKNNMFVIHYDNWYDKSKNNEDEINRAIEKGASSLLIQKETEAKVNIPVLIVENTYEALRKLALYASEKSNAKRVIISGSYGKTAFKVHLYELINKDINTYARLNSSNRVVSTYGNLASLKKDTEVLLLEIPIGTKGKTKRRSGYAKPDIFVLTSIGHEHIERHGTIEEIIKQKCSIAENLPKDGKVLIPFEDAYYPSIRKELNKYNHIKILTFGSHNSCDAQLLESKFEDNYWKVVSRIEEEIVSYDIPFIEVHAIFSSLAELLTAKLLGLDIKKLVNNYKKCSNYKSSGNYYKVKFLEKKIYLYDQSQRGGIEGYISFFKTASFIKPKGNGRKILLTSSFVDYEDDEMKYINFDLFRDLIKKANFDAIFSVEHFSEHMNVIEDKSIWKNHSYKYKDIKKHIFEYLEDGDILFVKGIFESELKWFLSDIKKISGVEVLINRD